MHPNRSVATILALALLSSSFSTPTQDPQQTSTGFVLEAGDHELLDLIDRVAEYLGRNFLMDPASIRAATPSGTARISLQKRLEVDALGCEELLSQLLYSKGFAIVPRDPGKGLYEVIAMQGPKRGEIQSGAVFMTPEEVLRRPNLKMTVLTAVPLEHIQVQVATNSLRPFFAQSSQVGAGLTLGNVGNNAAMLLQGFRHQVAAAIRVLRLVDVPQQKSEPTLADRIQALEKRVRELEDKHGSR
jgi:type II secretory pathway component GspD/PulD (secretin)